MIQRVSATVVSDGSPSSSGWLPGAPPGQATSGFSFRNSGSRNRLAGLSITAGSPPERYDAVISLATRRASSLIEVTGRPLRVVDLERDHEPGDAHRRVDDAAPGRRVRVERVDDQPDVGRARGDVARVWGSPIAV